jgi:cell cycle arrest protein BUB3
LSPQCHRKTENGKQVLYPVNCLAFHPRYGTFATGGCDGLVNVWDGANKKRISAYPAYATSVAALAFSARGDKLAVAASYTFEEGEKDHPNDAIYVRTVQPQEVLPKQQRQAASSAAALSSAASVSGAR